MKIASGCFVFVTVLCASATKVLRSSVATSNGVETYSKAPYAEESKQVTFRKAPLGYETLWKAPLVVTNQQSIFEKAPLAPIFEQATVMEGSLAVEDEADAVNSESSASNSASSEAPLDDIWAGRSDSSDQDWTSSEASSDSSSISFDSLTLKAVGADTSGSFDTFEQEASEQGSSFSSNEASHSEGSL